MIKLEHQKFKDNEYWTVVHTDKKGKRTILGELSSYPQKEGGGYSIIAGAGYESMRTDVRKGEVEIPLQLDELRREVEGWLREQQEYYTQMLRELEEWNNDR